MNICSTQPAFTCSKSTIATLEKAVKYNFFFFSLFCNTASVRKQPTVVFFRKSSSWKFRKIHRKSCRPEAQVFSCEFYEILEMLEHLFYRTPPGYCFCHWCLTFSWIELQMLLMCCLIHISIIIPRHFLYLLISCLDLHLFMSYLCDLFLISIFIFIMINHRSANFSLNFKMIYNFIFEKLW